MNKRVAVIGGRPSPIHNAKKLGIDVVLVHEEGAYEDDIINYSEQIVHADITDVDAMIAVLEPLNSERPFDRIMTTTENAGESTGKLVEHFKLPGVGYETAFLLKNKLAMRDHLEKNNLSPVAYSRINSKQDAIDFVNKHGQSVLKPTDGVASLHIHLCDDEASVLTALKALEDADIDGIIIEEFLEGPVVSVDSFSFEGRHLTIGYSQYRMNDKYVEWEVSTPSSDALPWLNELRAMTCELLDAVGLQEGPAHSEFILTPKGPRVLESHARLAGSGAPELVKRAFGLDLNRMFLTVPLGIDTLPEQSPAPIAGAAIQFFVPEPGIVMRINTDLPEDVVVRYTKPGQKLKVFLPYIFELGDAKHAVVIQKHEGDRVSPLDTVADCTSGYVLATGESREDAVKKTDEMVGQVTFEVESI